MKMRRILIFFVILVLWNAFDAFAMRMNKQKVNREVIQAVRGGDMKLVRNFIEGYSDDFTERSVNYCCLEAAKRGCFYPFNTFLQDQRLSTRTCINVRFIKAVLTKNCLALDIIFGGPALQWISVDSINFGCIFAARQNHSTFLKKLLNTERGSRGVQDGARLIKAVHDNNENSIRAILRENRYPFINKALNICYCDLAYRGDLKSLLKLATYTDQRVGLSYNCRFVNAVIVGRSQEIKEILERQSDQLATSIVNACYVIAAKKGYICLAFKLSSHPKFKFKTHWKAFNQTAYRDKPITREHTPDILKDTQAIIANLGVSANMVYSGVKNIFG